MSHLTDIKDSLTAVELKATHQRVVILDCVYHMNNHPNVEQIYEGIRENNPSISKATVYKTLETFVSAGLLRRVSTLEGQMRYDPRMDNHGHINCFNTKEIIDYYDEELNEMIVSFFKKKKVSNLKIKNITLQINGDKIDLSKEIHIK